MIYWSLFVSSICGLWLVSHVDSDSCPGYWEEEYDLSQLTFGGVEEYPDGNKFFTYVVQGLTKDGRVVPGKFVVGLGVGEGTCFYKHDSWEEKCNNVEHKFLYKKNSFAWELMQNGGICSEAVIGGYDLNDEFYYICRFTYYDGYYNQVLLGEYVPRQRLCYSAFGGKTRYTSNYEMLRDYQCDYFGSTPT